jgi:hypothetical protein
VVVVLNPILTDWGTPKKSCGENVSEFIGQILDLLSYKHEVK